MSIQTNKTIAQNTTILMGSQLGMWLLTTAIMIVLPRYLGVANVGKLQFASSLWLMIGVFVTFGTDTLLIKEIARNATQTSQLLSGALLLRSLLFIIACGMVAALVHILDYPTSTLYVIALVGVGSLVRQWIGAYQVTLQGLEKMAYFSIGEIVGNALYTGLGIILLLSGWGIYTIAILMSLGALANLAIQHIFLRRVQMVHFVFDAQFMWQMLKAGLPYLMSGFFLVAYMQVDVIIISWLVDEHTIGWYSAADRLFGTLLFIPSVYITAAFPAFSRLSKGHTDSLQKLISKSFDTLLLLGVPIGLGILVIANPLVILLFGEEFKESGPVLAIFGVVLIVTYQNILIGRLLIAIDRQNIWTLVMAIATIATIPLDIVLIPWCARIFQNGAIGGALSFLITESAMLVAGLLLLPKGSLNGANLWRLVRILLAGLGMTVAVWEFQNYFLGIAIFSGMVTYPILIFLLRVLPKEDIALLGQLVLQLQNKWRRPQTSSLHG
jgi:O-antigen/teichoic acid export membrane protein